MSTSAVPAIAHALGVCSWSLQPATPAELAEKVRAAGLTRVQLALDPISAARDGPWSEIAALNTLAAAGIAVESGMMGMKGEDYSTLASIAATGGVRSDEHWPANLAAAQRNARLAARVGLRLVTFHAGFIPHDPTDPSRGTMLARLREIIDVFADHAVRVGFETGQETADTLLHALDELDRPHAGVNFDPANMILYGMGDPVAALERLAPRVVQIHIKDARPTSTPGTWGTETPVGQGSVDWKAFFAVVRARGLPVPLMIEREAGGRRTDDIRAAAALARTHVQVRQ